MELLSGLGILIGFVLLALGAWKKIDLLLVTLAVSAVIALFSGLSVAETWSGPFMQGFSGFAARFLLLFSVGALFGKILDHSGAGWRIATTMANKAGERWSLWALILMVLLLLYGGVSIFVIVFFALPIGRSLFRRLRIPWSYFPGLVLIGSIPPVGMLPGSLQLLNIIPTRFLGTNLMAGPAVGIIATIVYLALGALYIKFIMRRSEELFDPAEFDKAEAAHIDDEEMAAKAPSFIASIVPIIVALLLINLFKIDIIYGLFAASALGLVLFRKSIPNIWPTVNKGITEGIMPLVYVSVIVGVARTVATVPFFKVAQDALLNWNVSGGFKVIATTSVFAAMTGSSSGSMTMILELFSKDFLAWGLSPQLLHRLVATAALGFDALPWNSVVVVFMTLAGISYAKGYRHIFVTLVIMPLISAFAILAVAPIFY